MPRQGTIDPEIGAAARDKAKRAKSRKLAAEDFLFFVRFCDPTYKVDPFHRALAKVLEDVANGKKKRVILSVPPRHGKSRLAAVEFPTWVFATQGKKEVVLASYSGDLSLTHSKGARERVESLPYRYLFPGTRLTFGSKSAQDWSVTTGGSYKATSVGGSLTGHGADVLIIDDPFADYEEAHSPSNREKVWNWYLSTAYTRLSAEGAIIVISTRWHTDDLIGRLRDPKRNKDMEDVGVTDENWEVIQFDAIASDNDQLGRKLGEALAPNRIPLQRLRAIRERIGSYLWAALYRNDPIIQGGNYIKVGQFKRINEDEAPKDLTWVRYWDLATDSKSVSDFSASARGAMDYLGNFYISTMVFGQWKWPDTRGRICDIGARERILVGLEDNGGFKIGVDNVREVMASGVLIRGYTMNRDKLTRALPWIAAMEAGKVFLVNGDWITSFLAQAEAFPNAAHDDLIDVISGLWIMLTQFVEPLRVQKPDDYSRALESRRKRYVQG